MGKVVVQLLDPNYVVRDKRHDLGTAVDMRGPGRRRLGGTSTNAKRC
jgi:hypothetical protein